MIWARSMANAGSTTRCTGFLKRSLEGELRSEQERKPRAKPRPRLCRSHKSAVCRSRSTESAVCRSGSAESAVRRHKTAVRRRKKAVRRRCVVGTHAAPDPHPAAPTIPRHPADLSADEIQAWTAMLLPRETAMAAQVTGLGYLTRIFFRTLQCPHPDAYRLHRKRWKG